MLKKIMVTSPILILFLFSISFLPLTQITEAEAQFSNKIQKPTHPSKAIKKPIEVNKARNFNKIQKQRSLSDAIKKPTPGTLTDKQKQKVLGQRMEWNFDTPMEKLIESINMRIEHEVFTAGQIRRNIRYGQTPGNPNFERELVELRSRTMTMLGCDAPNMITNPFCGGAPYYRDLLSRNVLIYGIDIDKFVTHKQLQFCGMPFEEIEPITARERADSGWNTPRTTNLRQQSPLSIKLRNLGKEFGTCFCKFGSRQGTHPSQGYDNIVPEEYNDFCPL